MKNNTPQFILAGVLVVLLFLLSDPVMLWMPPEAVSIVLLALAVLMTLWAGFVMKETRGDEREVYHRMNAGRIAYLAGLAVLMIALVVQGLGGAVDIWIAITLAVMVLSKLGARLYLEHRG